MNRTQLVGRIESNPVREFVGQCLQARFRLSTVEHRADRASWQQFEHLEWHQVVCHDRLAEVALAFLSEGSQIYVEGRLQTSCCTHSSSHQPVASMELRADDLHVLCEPSQRETIEMTILAIHSIEHWMTNLAHGGRCAVSLLDLVGMLEVLRSRLIDERDGRNCSVPLSRCRQVRSS